jgi:hypothetical protein
MAAPCRAADLEPDGPLPRDDMAVIERRHEHCAPPLRETSSLTFGASAGITIAAGISSQRAACATA